MISEEQLKDRLEWGLKDKKIWFYAKFSEFFLAFEGNVYLLWSGGMDSDTGCHLVRKIWHSDVPELSPGMQDLLRLYPEPPRVHGNTGLEFPEITEHVKKYDGDLEIVKPLMGYKKVVEKYGFAIGSKQISMQLERLKGYLTNPSEKNTATKNLYMYGQKKDGSKSKGSKLSERWKFILFQDDIKISGKCCDVFKKQPFYRYEEKTGRKPVIFTTVSESNMRRNAYKQSGCNTMDKGKEKCRPFSIFTKKDAWDIAEEDGLRFADVYYDRTVDVKQLDGSFKTESLPAEERTGCVICVFGAHLESKEKPNRMQRLSISHPVLYDAFVNKCGLGTVLLKLKIPFKTFIPKKTDAQQKLPLTL